MVSTYAGALGCVVGLVIGQILFKLSAQAIVSSGTPFAVKVAIPLFSAFFLYGVSSLAWVWVLQKADLGRVYPITALAFVLVPLASHFVFGERFHWQYVVGISLIILGIIISVKS